MRPLPGWTAGAASKRYRRGLKKKPPPNGFRRLTTTRYSRQTCAHGIREHSLPQCPVRPSPLKLRHRLPQLKHRRITRHRRLRHRQTTPPITVTEEKPAEQENSQSSDVTEADYDNEWWDRGWNHHDWSYGHGWGDNDWHRASTEDWVANWADEPPETPRLPDKTASPQISSPVAAEVAPAVTTISPPTAPDGYPDTVVNSPFRAEQVTVQTRTQSVEVTRPNETQTMMALHRLAFTGAPLTREDRIARQSLANQLTLSPELYNLLVFGEEEEGSHPAAVTDAPPTCAAPPGTESLPPP